MQLSSNKAEQTNSATSATYTGCKRDLPLQTSGKTLIFLAIVAKRLKKLSSCRIQREKSKNQNCTLHPLLLGKKSRFIGGPMYFMKRGLSSNLLPVIFCLATICTAVLGGNLVQVNSLTLPMQYFGINPLYGGIFIALIFALVILAGVRTFARVEDLSYVVHLRASDKSKLRSTEIELLLANLQLLLHDINEILNLGKIKFQPWSNAQFCLFPDFRFYCR